MLKETVNTIDGASKDLLLEQLAAVQETLTAIEDKIEPAPARYPDTFEQLQIFAAPYVKHGNEFYQECMNFRGKIDRYMMTIRGLRRQIPSKGNVRAWDETYSRLSSAFEDMAMSAMQSVSALGAFYLHTMHMAAMACDCDTEKMNTILEQAQAPA